MSLRWKWRTSLCALLATVCAILATGCASWQGPRIDPSGERLLIWPGQPTVAPPPTLPPVGAPAAPPAFAPPVGCSADRCAPRPRLRTSDFRRATCRRRQCIQTAGLSPAPPPVITIPQPTTSAAPPPPPIATAPTHSSRPRSTLNGRSRHRPSRRPDTHSCSRRWSRAAATEPPCPAGPCATK